MVSDPKHTPGPWHAISSLAWSDRTWILRDDPAPEDDPWIIATLDGPPDSPDARLIAAAPALLSVCRRFLQIPDSGWPLESLAEVTQVIADMHAAVTEATGEQP